MPVASQECKCHAEAPIQSRRTLASHSLGSWADSPRCPLGKHEIGAEASRPKVNSAFKPAARFRGERYNPQHSPAVHLGASLRLRYTRTAGVVRRSTSLAIANPRLNPVRSNSHCCRKIRAAQRRAITCTVAVKDIRDVEHSIEVTAETLYEANRTRMLQQEHNLRFADHLPGTSCFAFCNQFVDLVSHVNWAKSSIVLAHFDKWRCWPTR
jgi:hypothetical protein